MNQNLVLSESQLGAIPQSFVGPGHVEDYNIQKDRLALDSARVTRICLPFKSCIKKRAENL